MAVSLARKALPEGLILVGSIPPPHNGQTIAFEMLVQSARALAPAVSLVNLPAREGSRGDQFVQVLRFPFSLLRYLAVVLWKRGKVYLTIAQSRQGFFRDAFIIWVGWLFRHPVVGHLHGGNYNGFYAKQPAIRQWLIRRTLRRTHSVIILSERLRPMFDFEPALASRLRVIPNGLPLNLTGSGESKQLPANPEEPIQILYLSNLVESKGYFDLLEAVAVLVNGFKLNIEAHFCGTFLAQPDDVHSRTVEQARKRFFDFIREHGLERHVQFHGAVLGDDKVALLKSAHIFVLPTNYINEGQPISIIEALAYGTVVVSTAFRAIPDMVVEGVTGRLVAFRDPQRLARVIADIAQDPDGYRRMSAAAYMHYLAHYTGQTHTTALLESLCGRPIRDGKALHELARSTGRNQLVEYFDGIAHGWGEKYVEGGRLKPRVERCLRPLRGRLGAGSKVLDFGCGSGQISFALEKAGYSVTGLDTSPAMIGAARRTCAVTGIEFLEIEPSAWSKIPVHEGTFDAVVASSVLEYVPEPAEQIRELVRVLRDGGVIVVTVPNPSHPGRVVERPLRMIARISLMTRVFPLLPKRLAAYCGYLALSINHFALGTWVKMLGSAGLRIDEVSEAKSPLIRIVATKKVHR